MKLAFASGLSTAPDSFRAADQVIAEVRQGLAGRGPDLGILFMTPQHAPRLEETVERIAEALGAPHLIGCTGQGVMGGGREVEGEPGIGLFAASLPGADIRTFHMQAESTPEGLAYSGLPEGPPGPATLLLLPEPFSFDPVGLFSRLEEDRQDLQILGGMASGAFAPGENRLFLGGRTLVDGAVGALISGPLRVRAVVSQGCRPFGRPMVVTRAERNVIRAMGGKSPLERLEEQAAMLPERERDRSRLYRRLFLGRAIDASRPAFGRGDFLVRNVVGIDEATGAIAVTDGDMRPGQTVQFHVRDARCATEELEDLLQGAKTSGAAPAGALLFSCNGRGSYLFGRPDHDAGAIQRQLGPLPLSGFFAAGELGPVGGRNFVHGFTASIALFEEA